MFRIRPADHAYAPIRRHIYRQPELRTMHHSRIDRDSARVSRSAGSISHRRYAHFRTERLTQADLPLSQHGSRRSYA
jgi:hypothetical protein